MSPEKTQARGQGERGSRGERGTPRTETSISAPVASRLFAPRWLGIAGTIASLISIPLAIYFYSESRREPGLSFQVNPARASLVRFGESSWLEVRFAGKPVTANISAVQIAVWNGGNQSIRATQVLTPIWIQLGDSTEVLESTVRKQTRDVVALAVAADSLNPRRVGLRWNILEHGDGGVIQIIFSGPTGAVVSLAGTVEGQRHIREFQTGSGQRIAGLELSRRQAMLLLGLFTLAIGVFILMPLAVMRIMLRRRPRTLPLTLLDKVMLIVPIAYLILGLVMILGHFAVSGPPFGF